MEHLLDETSEERVVPFQELSQSTAPPLTFIIISMDCVIQNRNIFYKSPDCSHKVRLFCIKGYFIIRIDCKE